MPRRRLEPGQDNIASTNPKRTETEVEVKLKNGRTKTVKKVTWSMQWYINIDGTVTKHFTRTQGGTANDCRQQARARAEELRRLARLPGEGAWTLYSQMNGFVEKVCEPAVEANDYEKPLRPKTQARYLRCLALYREQIGATRIVDAVVPAKLSDTFKAIATAHGNPSAKQAAKVVSKYVMDVAVAKQVIDHNPLRPLTISVTVAEDRVRPHRGDAKPKGGQALSPEDRARVVDYLLELDPTSPARKRWTAEQQTAKRACLIDITLTQATCGLRIAEARRLTRADISEHDGLMWLTVTEDVSKTHRGREVPVIDERVAERLRGRLNHVVRAGASAPVFPAPASGGVWERGNCQKAVRAFYDELADTLDIPLLHDVATHAWRATLNSEWADLGISAERLAAYFGHSVDVNRARYTDLTDVSEIARMLRSQDVHQDVSIAVTQGDSQ